MGAGVGEYVLVAVWVSVCVGEGVGGVGYGEGVVGEGVGGYALVTVWVSVCVNEGRRKYVLVRVCVSIYVLVRVRVSVSFQYGCVPPHVFVCFIYTCIVR